MNGNLTAMYGRRFIRRLVAAFAFMAITCGISTAKPAAEPPLEKIWDTAASRFLLPQDLIRTLAAARFVLLGETHDDLTHHNIQARVLAEIVSQGRQPAIVMEQYDLEQQDEIDAILASALPLDDTVKRLLQVMPASWDRDMYRPILQVGVRASLPIVAANLSRDAARKIAREGFGTLPGMSAKNLKLDDVWNDAREAETIKALQDGHCGMLPAEALPGMAKAQRARDAVMADRLLQQQARGAVAILGRGHVLKNLAVPLYLRARSPNAATISVGLVQAGDLADSSLSVSAEEANQFDYVWLTPAVQRDGDPCAAFRTAPKSGGTRDMPR